ncbi:sulfotransferase family protein [Salinibacter grassmerensis]|uniref:sulfotransferase family protein n=1 Tax=Salinibacter grassmerensis TaxID=3040353 RepID=UPI0021E7A0C3|nr:sulfotransferase [Salinibacter grassmerensis]
MNKLNRLLQVAVNAYWEYKPWWTPRRWAIALDEIDIDRPIFILGVQGGGLTLLTRMLHRNPNIVTIGGGRAYWVGNNEMDKQYTGELPEDFTLRSPKFQSPTFKTHMTGTEDAHPVFGRERNWVYACDDLLDQYRRTESDWSPDKEAQLRRAMKESIRAYALDIRRARFLDMSQTFSLKVPLLRKIFPDARFVVQTRDPYATCIKEARDDGYKWRRKTGLEQKLTIFAEHWRNTYAYTMNDLKDHAHKITVRYEDLVQSPEDELRRIAEAIDLEYRPDMVPQDHHRLPFGSSESHKWFPVRTGVNEKHLSHLRPGAASVIQENVEDVAHSFGYRAPD